MTKYFKTFLLVISAVLGLIINIMCRTFVPGGFSKIFFDPFRLFIFSSLALPVIGIFCGFRSGKYNELLILISVLISFGLFFVLLRSM